MANKKSKATVTSIKFSSRCSMKIGDNFYTSEACEERSLPEGLTEAELLQERKMLWNTVNEEVDHQCEEIWETVRKARNKK